MLAAAVILGASGPAAAGAATVKGVTFPDTVSIGGRACRLNGVGAWTKYFVNIYLGALYLASPSGEAAAAIAADEPKRFVMHFVYRKVEAGEARAAFLHGLRDNAGDALPLLQERIDRMLSWIDQDARAGDEIALTYVPGSGTEVVAMGRVRGVIEGADFMRALWSIWLGPRPAGSGLKKALLGAR